MNKLVDFLVAVALSAVFTLVLTFLVFEVARVMNEFLLNFFPDQVLLSEWEKTKEVVECLRPYGYAAFGAVLGLIISGFLVKKCYLSTVGSIFLYLPVFGHFAFTMFFLAGVGVMRFLWLPMLDLSPLLLQMGDVVYTPYFLILFLFRIVGLDVAAPLSLIIMSAGILVFMFGVSAWLYGKFNRREIVDFWIYKYSRHPQYLGFLLWTYGLLTLTTFLPTPRGGYFPSPSLPWLVSALTVVAVALLEEIQMVKSYGEKYIKYRDATPFMLPLPRQLSKLTTRFVNVLIKKSLPESGKEILCIITIFGFIFILLSIPFLLI